MREGESKWHQISRMEKTINSVRRLISQTRFTSMKMPYMPKSCGALSFKGGNTFFTLMTDLSSVGTCI